MLRLQNFRIEGRAREKGDCKGVPYMNQVASGFMDFEKGGQHY